MTSEEILKEFICAKYKSIRQFAIMNGLKYSTITAILARGLKKSNIDNVLEICNALDISTEALVLDKMIVPLRQNSESKQAQRIEAYANYFKIREDSMHYTIDGVPLTEEERKQFKIGMELLIDFIRKQRKYKE